MHECTTPVQRKRLIDPAACGIRLGVELRAAAEREAYRSGMCLSHWIKQIVENAVQGRRENSQEQENTPVTKSRESKLNSETDFSAAYASEMEKLYVK